MRTLKLNLLKVATFMLLLTGMSACENSAEENEISAEISFLEYSLLETNCQWTNLTYDNKVIIINSNKDLGKYLTCTESSFPEIDFSKQTLLLASGRSTNGVGRIESSFYQNTTNKYTWKVTIHLGITAIVQPWNLCILTSKVSDKAKIVLDVQETHY